MPELQGLKFRVYVIEGFDQDLTRRGLLRSLKHQNKKPEYIKDWWNVVNWGQVSQNYDLAKAGRESPGATTAGREGVDR